MSKPGKGEEAEGGGIGGAGEYGGKIMVYRNDIQGGGADDDIV